MLTQSSVLVHHPPLQPTSCVSENVFHTATQSMLEAAASLSSSSSSGTSVLADVAAASEPITKESARRLIKVPITMPACLMSNNKGWCVFFMLLVKFFVRKSYLNFCKEKNLYRNV